MGLFDRLRTWRARERYMPLPRRIRRGTTALIAVAVIATTLAISLVLDLRSSPGDAALLAWAEANATDPVAMIERETRSRSVLLLGDVIGAAAPKRLAAMLIDTLGLAGRLEAVGLEVPADQQTWIDLYLQTDPEDTSVLLANPRSVRGDEGTDRALLGVYRAVWRVNSVLGVNRRIRIFALDPPTWPPAPGLSPARTLGAFAQRDSFIHATLDAQVLERNPRARVLVFVDGLRVQRGGARLAAGGIAPIEMEWLGQRLADRGVSSFSVLVDAPRGPGAFAPIAGHRAGRLFDLLRNRLSIPENGLALPVTAAADLSPDWMGSPARPGIEFHSLPEGYALGGRFDAWVFLAN
jgi:hypothetical protein